MELENSSAYPEVCHKILEDLSKNLPGYLTYHTLDHTVDVANVCNRYIAHYRVADSAARLIRIAAVAHDYGYIHSPVDHEERSIREIRPLLSGYGDREIALIGGMIRATRIPQQPGNLYEEILADADLDYLGREDYEALSERLYRESLHLGEVRGPGEWLELQIRFLEQHRFHTGWARRHRSDRKEQVLQSLKARAGQPPGPPMGPS